MILDTLACGTDYRALSAGFESAFAFLRQVTDHTVLGRHEIAGDDVFALVQRYATTPVGEREYESHRKYIDVQYVQRGRELMYWAPVTRLTVGSLAYVVEQDAALYRLTPDGAPLQVLAGQFAIFFPEDGHIPGCTWDYPGEVLKVVIKVRV